MPEGVKQCSRCGEVKPLDDFPKNHRFKDGRNSICKLCKKSDDAKRYRDNREQYAEKRDSWRAENRDRNREIQREATARWKSKNPNRVGTEVLRYRELLSRATPAWADKKAIAAVYAEARRKTKETGEVHSVDHIVPLSSPVVCGLHVASNLEVITRQDNASKKNRRWPDMP